MELLNLASEGLEEGKMREVIFDRVREEEADEGVECYEERQVFEGFGLGFENVKRLEGKNARIRFTENVLKYVQEADKHKILKSQMLKAEREFL